MYRKDYLQRQFEQFGKVLAQLLSYKRREDWDKFETEMNLACKDFTEKNLNELESLELEAFEVLMQDESKLDTTQKKILATLLFEKLGFYQLIGKTIEYEKCGKKCLSIYQYLNENQTDGDFDLDLRFKLDALKQLGFRP